MFLSSPARRFGPPPVSEEEKEEDVGGLRVTRQPYHHQVEEFKRDELRRGSQPVPLPSNDRAEYKEVVGDLPAAHRPFNRPWTSYGGSTAIRRSPSKSFGSGTPPGGGKPSLSSPVGSTAGLSNSLVLTIGKDGRAKTEMQVVSEPPPLSSKNRDGERPPSKGSVFSSGSTTNRRPAYRRASEAKRTPTKRPLTSAEAEEAETDIDSDDYDGDDGDDDGNDSGYAQHALRQVLQSRRQSALPAHLRSSPPQFGSEIDVDSRTSPSAMTDPDYPTPGGQGGPSNGTRCVCNSVDNGGHLMIQW